MAVLIEFLLTVVFELAFELVGLAFGRVRVLVVLLLLALGLVLWVQLG